MAIFTRERVQHTEPMPRRRRFRGPSGMSVVLIGVTVLGATALFWLVHDALIDDAYITLAYARTLAEHGEWGMVPGHVANTATSPLNVLLLGGLSAVVGDPVMAAGVLYVGTCVALVTGLRGIGKTTGLGDRVAVIGGPLLIASPLLASTIGLETMLVAAAMTFLALACLKADPIMAGVTAGVLLWLRLDTVVVATILVLATPPLWRRLHVVATLASAVVTPWLVFSWFVLGSAIPDTLVLKQGGWGNYLTGLVEHFGEPYTWAIGGVLLIAALGLVSAVTWPWWRRRIWARTPIAPSLVAAGAAYFTTIWVLDVPPFFWYYAPPFVALVLAATLGLAALSSPPFGRWVQATAIAIGAGLLVVAAIPWWYGMTTRTPLRETPVRGNWAMPGQYEEIGRELGIIVGDSPVRSAGEVGALAYFCRCTIVDRFSIRSRLTEHIADARHDSWFYRLNYFMLDTGELHPIKPEYWLDWRRGPDTTPRDWNATGIDGTRREHGHYELLTRRPHR